MSNTIVLTPVTPADPIVLCSSGFLDTLADVEQRVAALKVVDATTCQQAADLQTRLTAAGRKLEEARKVVKEPFLAKCREIDVAAKEPATRIEAAKDRLKRVLLAYSEEQDRKRRLEEEARRKEIARLEELKRKEELEAQERARKIAESAKKAEIPVMELDFDDQPTETQKAIDAAKIVPMPEPVAPVGVSFRTSLRIAEVKVDGLPVEFVIRTADMALLRKTFCTGWKDGDPIPKCDGVVFQVEKTPISTGRSVF